ncbi:hypothetical protein AB9E11_36300, partial [Rhizobium leguminosarum]
PGSQRSPRLHRHGRREPPARDEKVKALVYIAALAPDEGETVADIFYRGEPHPKAPKLAPDSHGRRDRPLYGGKHRLL